MKNSVKLMTSALALGFAMSGFAQDATTSDTAAKDTAKPKVIIEIPKQAIESGKIIIRDGQVYARIGKADKMADGSGVVVLDAYGGGQPQPWFTEPHYQFIGCDGEKPCFYYSIPSRYQSYISRW